MPTTTMIARLGVLLLFALLSAACTRGLVVRTKTVEVPVVKTETPPSRYLTDTPLPRLPEGECWFGTERVLCNAQLQRDRDANADALGMCNADKGSARAWGETRKAKPH